MQGKENNTEQLKFLIQQIKFDAEREKEAGYKEIDKRIEAKIRQRLMALAYAVNIPVSKIVSEFTALPTSTISPNQEKQTDELDLVVESSGGESGYGKLTNSIKKIASNIGSAFSSTDIYKALQRDIPNIHCVFR